MARAGMAVGGLSYQDSMSAYLLALFPDMGTPGKWTGHGAGRGRRWVKNGTITLIEFSTYITLLRT